MILRYEHIVHKGRFIFFGSILILRIFVYNLQISFEREEADLKGNFSNSPSGRKT